MIKESTLVEILKIGRIECYVKKSSTYNPYRSGDIYDWDFELTVENYRFTDSYRGFNPYSGVEYIFTLDSLIPLWTCDYVGYARGNELVSENEIYGFLKRARGNHLTNHNINLFDHFTINEGLYKYNSNFSGDFSGLLQIEEINFNGQLVGRQITSGRLRKKGKCVR